MLAGNDITFMFLGLLAFVAWVMWLLENRKKPADERLTDMEARVEAAMDHAVEVRAEFNALAAAVGLRRKSPGELPKPPPWFPPGS